MYSARYESLSGVLVFLLHGADDAGRDREAFFEALNRLDSEGAGRPTGTVALLGFARGYPRPDATWRRQLADIRGKLRSRPHLLALFSPDAAVRGITIAVGWLAPLPAGVHQCSHASFAEASRWVQSQLGRPTPALERLYTEARVALTNSGVAWGEAII